jgi:hypothetical protein
VADLRIHWELVEIDLGGVGKAVEVAFNVSIVERACAGRRDMTETRRVRK